MSKRKRDFPRLAMAVHGEPWLLHPSKWLGMAELLAEHASGARDITAFWDDDEDESEEQPPEQGWTLQGRVAVVPLHGVIGKRLSGLALLCGGADVDRFQAALLAAAADARVAAVVLDIDSPGGTVTGTPETAALVARVAEELPVVAYSEMMMCSAAYYIGSGAGSVVVSPSATAGSVGVVWGGKDDSKRWADAGVKAELFVSGTQKGLGTPGVAWSEDWRAAMQGRVDDLAADFHGFVRAHRAGVSEEVFATAGAWSGERLRSLGLVDDFAATLGDCVAQVEERLG